VRALVTPAVVSAAWLACLPACKVKDAPPITQPFYDSFDRAELGANWFATGDAYRIVDGALSARGGYNHPLWLRKKLPRNVRIEVDVWSTEPRGDIKVEVFGDGSSYDPDRGGYLATAYMVIFGGWSNSKSIIARMDEHGRDLVSRADVKVIPNRHYHWKIERTGGVVRWFVDDMDTPFLELDDKDALEGPGHEYFAVNNWETDTWFDNLVVTPL